MVSVQHSIANSTDLESLPTFLAEGLGEEALGVFEQAIHWIQERYTEQTTPYEEPLWEHTLGVAMIAVSMRLDLETRLAALLFSLCNGSGLTAYKSHKGEISIHDKIKAHFGEVVAQLVIGMERLYVLHHRAVTASTDIFTQAEVLRKMVLALVDDIRVVLLWLASHVQTLRFFTHDKKAVQLKVVRESFELCAPLANRLGVWQLKWELEDLSFRFLEPDTYKRIAKMLDERRVEREAFILDAVARLKKEVAALGIATEVYGRPKHIYSIYHKMQAKNLDFEQVYDVRALRVMVKDVQDCYKVLGLVHALWTPIPNEFDDYILQPKGNNYQSLHTAVRAADGRSLEVQIRTFDMHRHAELGVAAHWRYKEGTKQGGSYDEKIALLRELLSWREEIVTDTVAWEEQMRRAALDDTIYVVTPQGRVIDMVAGATPIDFAYRLHTDLGHRCRGAKADGQMISLNTPLSSGQVVEIITSKLGGPSRDWLNPQQGYLATSNARTKVRRWFTQQEEEETATQGRAIVLRQLQRAGQTHASLEDLAARLGFKETTAFFLAVGRGDVGSRQVHNAVYTPPQNVGSTPSGKDLTQTTHAQVQSHNKGNTSGILVVGVGKLLTQLARCCKPAPPDQIRGFITRGRGVSIHREDCASFLQLAKHHAERIIPVEWGNQTQVTSAKSHALKPKQEVYPVDVAVEAIDRQGLLRDISDVFSHDKLNVTGVNTISKSGRAYMRFTVELASLDLLPRVLQHVGSVKGVEKAQRG